MTIMADDKMMAQISGRDGFIAALDQSGGSTPGALRLYGILDNAYSSDAEMFRLMHQMRVRIMTAPAFTGAKAGAEAILLAELTRQLDAAPDGPKVMLQLTIRGFPDFYAALTNHKRIARVVALSGGYTRADACQRLAANHRMIASFSRALVQDLRGSMSDTEFEAALAQSIDEIHRASTVKA